MILSKGCSSGNNFPGLVNCKQWLSKMVSGWLKKGSHDFSPEGFVRLDILMKDLSAFVSCCVGVALMPYEETAMFHLKGRRTWIPPEIPPVSEAFLVWHPCHRNGTPSIWAGRSLLEPKIDKWVIQTRRKLLKSLVSIPPTQTLKQMISQGKKSSQVSSTCQSLKKKNIWPPCWEVGCQIPPKRWSMDSADGFSAFKGASPFLKMQRVTPE